MSDPLERILYERIAVACERIADALEALEIKAEEATDEDQS